MYPLKFKPILKQMLWGGKKLPATYGIEVDADTKVGESFLVSGLSQDTSVVANGEWTGKPLNELIAEHGAALLGQSIYEKHGERFPLLIKIIDAADDLSIQVHPDDEMGEKKHSSNGKTEMWYIVDREADSTLVSGFTRPTSAEEFRKLYEQGELMELMQSVPTEPGDTFFIPAGKVHSIGSGNLIAEIQQTSDLTYRIYDFDRRDKEGNLRELHHELAYEAMDYADDQTGKVDYELVADSAANLAECDYFTTNVMQLNAAKEMDYANLDSFVIYIVVNGSCKVAAGGQEVVVDALEAVMIPAQASEVTLAPVDGECKVIETYIK